MKKLICIVCTTCAAFLFADSVAAVTPKVVGTSTNNAERIRMRLEKRAKKLAELGGVITKKQDGGIIRVVSAQNRVAQNEFLEVVDNISRSLTMPVEFSSIEVAKCPNDIIKAAFKLPKTSAVVALIANDTTPTLLIAPESGWAIVNVQALAEDLPPEDVLKVRVRKEIWRAMAMALGAANSQMQPCIMSNVTKLEDLDKNPMLMPCPEPVMKMCSAAQARGIQVIRRATYKRALAEGWAPAPTNDIQRALWEAAKNAPKK